MGCARAPRVAALAAMALAAAALAASCRARPELRPGRPAIEGQILGRDGQPVAGAIVVAIAARASGFEAGRLAALATTTSEGRLRLEVPPGEYVVTATAPRLMAAASAPLTVTARGAPPALTLALGAGGFTLSGRVHVGAGGAARAEGSAVAGARVLAIPTTGEGRAFVTLTGAAGQYRLRVPAGEYYVVPDSDRDLGPVEPRIERRLLDADDPIDLALEPVLPEPPADRAPLIAWLQQAAIPVRTAAPGDDLADLRPLARVVGGARLVGLGEATHGTREFFQLKHRIVQLLVTELGFTGFAIEAGWAEALAINDYVLGGPGDAAALLAGLGVWPWQTEEVVELIEWIRRYNADPAHAKKVTFHGFDMQRTDEAARRVAAYLAGVDPAAASAALPGDGAALRARLVAHQDTYVARAGLAAWTLAEHCATILVQAERWRSTGKRGPVRDRAMAENIRWIAEQAGPGAKLVLWAHNGHVSFRQNWMYPAGMHLRAWYGADYLAIGFLFDEGRFQAMAGEPPRLVEVQVPPAPDRFFEAALARVGHPRFVFDLRAAPEGVTPWLASTVVTRQADALFRGEEAMEYPLAPAANYDAIVFVDSTTRAVPTARAVERYVTPPP